MDNVKESIEEKSSQKSPHERTSEKRKKRESSRDKDYKSEKKKRQRSTSRSPRRRDSDRTRDHHRKSRKYEDLDYPEQYQRYYGEDDKSKSNSDLYWSKYPSSKETGYVGSRYYGADKEGNKENKSSRKEVEDKDVDKSIITPRQRKTVDLLTSKTGGAYIPPAKLKLMQAEITDKSSAAYQRIAWEALKKSIHGYINKINTSNIGLISRELLHENIVRGRGLLCKSIIQAQAASPTFTHVYAALVAVINSKFPNIGELLLRRLVLQFKRGFKQNNKSICISATTFIAHLVNQKVAHEILALEILTLLIESPTDDSIEVAISFLKEVGQKLTEVSSKGINAIFEMLRNILHEGQLEKRIQYMIEVMFQIRKDGFKDHAAVIEELDLVQEEEQFTHLIMLDEAKNGEDILNVFKFDEQYEENEGKYKTLSKEILGSDVSESEGGSGSEESDDSDDEGDEAEEKKDADMIIDNTETNLVILRRTIYLTIQSSLDFEECAHKLMKMELKPGQEIELCHMFLDCCAEQRTYEKFYGLLSQRFCQINRVYVDPFQQIFKDTFQTTHRLDANRLRNVSKFFAHLLFTDSISWEVLDIMKLNEEDTTSSSRIFIKILFQELAEYMGLAKLNKRLKDETLQPYFTGLFPRDNPKNTRFAINFFTSIGLGGLTDELREHIKSMPKMPQVSIDVEDSSDSSSSSSSSSNSSSNSSSSSDSSSSESEESDKGESSRKKKVSKSKTTDKKKKLENRGNRTDESKSRSKRSKVQSPEEKTTKSSHKHSGRDNSRQNEKEKDDRTDESPRHRKMHFSKDSSRRENEWGEKRRHRNGRYEEHERRNEENENYEKHERRNEENEKFEKRERRNEENETYDKHERRNEENEKYEKRERRNEENEKYDKHERRNEENEKYEKRERRNEGNEKYKSRNRDSGDSYERGKTHRRR